MPFQRYCFILLAVILLIAGTASANDNTYNYIKAKDLETRLKAKTPTNIVDIQVEDEFGQHHIPGAIPTHAYPVKSDTDRAKLDTAIAQINTNTDPVVIVCPRGAGGAKRAYDYLQEQSVPAERLLILENGQGGWFSSELTESQ
ncbi:MAG: rhodanese-like domain-containing protein [Desulfuromonadales bacterium]